MICLVLVLECSNIHISVFLVIHRHLKHLTFNPSYVGRDENCDVHVFIIVRWLFVLLFWELWDWENISPVCDHGDKVTALIVLWPVNQ